MKIILDTSFILTCIKQKIDFNNLANNLFDEKIIWIIPKEVINELQTFEKRKGEKFKDKESASLALKIIKITPHKTINLPTKKVDEGIIRYAKRNQAIIATLDKEIKQKFSGKILTIRGKKSLEII